MNKPAPYACPHCGNTTEQEGITHCFLEWRISAVEGCQEGKVFVDWSLQEGCEVDKNSETTAKNMPNVKPDLDHFTCNKCGWNWYDHQNKKEDVWFWKQAIERREVFDASLKQVPWGHYREVKFIRPYAGTAHTKDYGDGSSDPVDRPEPVVFARGDTVKAGIMKTGPGTVSLELEGLDHGVGHVHGLTANDIEILA